MDVFPDCVLPSIQNTGAGVLVRRSASVASRSGGGAVSPVTVRFTASHSRLMDGLGRRREWPQKSTRGTKEDQDDRGLRTQFSVLLFCFILCLLCFFVAIPLL